VLTESSNLFQKPYKNSLPLRVQINLSHALIEKKQSQGMQMRLKELGDNIGQLNDSKQRAELMLSLGRLYQLAQKELKLGSDFRSQAYDWFTKTAELAKGLQDPVLNTYLDGFTGQLYEDEARYDEAMIFTRRAVVSAQGAQSDEALFKWEWQLARLLNNKGDGSAALNSYRQAISTLQRVRLSLLMGARSNFKRYIEPVYYQYFDLLLKQARAQQSSKQIYKLLRETVDALENYRVSEVEDYFQSACVESDTNNSVNNIDPSTAVIYPVILDDRVELIVAINNRLTLYTKTISRTQVTNTLRSFREKLENPRLQSGYLQDAQALYGWLVEPFVEDAKKEKIQNLMYVPDGPLRSIPMAALHDGNNYLIEKFSTVTTPSLALTKLGKPEPFIAKMLASGVTKAVQGYDALPSVGYELSNVSRSRSTQSPHLLK
jgi:hypothetical protein